MQFYKSLFVVLSFTVCIASSQLYAQSFFGFGGSNKSATPAETNPQQPPTSIKVMTPSDFKSTVNTLHQQTQKSLSQQLNQQIAKMPPIPAQQPSPNAPKQAGQPLPSIMNSSGTPNTNAPQQPQAQPNGIPTTVTPDQQQQQDIYTGFGGGNKQNENTNSSGQSGGGWNIKY